MMSKWGISAFIIAVMLLHGVPIVQEMRASRQSVWPIMAWGMYRSSHSPPVQTTSWKVIAETSRGDQERIGSLQVGLGPNAFSRLYVQPMSKGDSATARKLGEILNRERGVRIAKLVLTGVTHRVTDEGVVETIEPTMTYPLED